MQEIIWLEGEFVAKSQIIKDIANGTISLETALTRALVIASDIENDKFKEWIEKEISGYSSEDDIPEYRISKDEFFKYTGRNGGYMCTDMPLPLPKILCNLNLDPEYFYVNIYDGINGIEKFLGNPDGKELIRDLTFLAGEVYKVNGLQCASIKQVIPLNAFENVINKVKSKLLQSLIYLDKMYGSLDDLDVDTSSKTPEEINQINMTVVNYIYKDVKITVADSVNFQKGSVSVKEGDIKMEDNSVKIGDNNVVESSVVSAKNGGEIEQKINDAGSKDKWYSKIAWNIIAPIIVGVAVVTICVWLGIQS